MLTPLPDAKPHIFASFRDRRLKTAFEPANMIWFYFVMRGTWPALSGAGLLETTRCLLIRMPKNNPPRERRLRVGEYEALRDAVPRLTVMVSLANCRYRN